VKVIIYIESTNKYRIGLQVYTFFFLALKGRQHTSPGQRPWVKINQYLSPVRAQHKDKLKRTHSKNVTPLQGLKLFIYFTRALPWAGMLPPFQG